MIVEYYSVLIPDVGLIIDCFGCIELWPIEIRYEYSLFVR